MMIIYCIENKVNGKKYFGKTKNFYMRLRKHINNFENGVNRHLYASMKKYGIDRFTAYIMEYCDDKIINYREIYYISKYKTNDRNFGYNMTSGGDGGNTLVSWSEDKKKTLYFQQSQKRIGHLVSNKTREKISKANKGKKITKEQRKKISDTIKEKYKSGEWIPNTNGIIYMSRNNHPMKNKKHTTESRIKMSISKKNKKYEEIYGENIALKLKEDRRISHLGNNNPMWAGNIDFDNLNTIIKSKNLTLKEISNQLNTSSYVLRDRIFKKFGKKYSDYKKDILKNVIEN